MISNKEITNSDITHKKIISDDITNKKITNSYILNSVTESLNKIIGMPHLLITTRGNASIKTVLSIIKEQTNKNNILIPDEGGWLTYETEPIKWGLEVGRVKCDDSRINLVDLNEKLSEKNYGAFIYHQPGGYFAKQPMKEIYEICQKHDCLVIMDVSGSIGTELYESRYADIVIGSFGKWKLVDAGKGGFIASNDDLLFEKIRGKCLEYDNLLNDEKLLSIINDKLENLPARIEYLSSKRKKIVDDLKDNFEIIYPNDYGLVVIVKFKDDIEKGKILEYCKDNHLEWTECPRYIRLNQKAISIEVKRL
jgi:hypothetical protein